MAEGEGQSKKSASRRSTLLGERTVPAELAKEAPDRLTAAAALIAVTFFLSWVAAPPSWRPPGAFRMLDVVTAVAVVLSLFVVHLSRRNRTNPLRVMRIGLAYELAVCAAISLVEQWLPWPPDQLVRGVSWVCIVLVAFPLTVPAPPIRTLWISLAGALTGPVAVVVAVLAGHPAPSSDTVFALFLPNFLAAGLALVLSRLLQRLGKQAGDPKQAGSYTLVRLLGRGGMGEVWVARHAMIARPAAVKFVRPNLVGLELGEDPNVVFRRFEREARTTASLSSPHTISLFDFGYTDDGAFYYVMELLDGVDLETLVKRYGPQPAERVIALLIQVCASLAEAHAQGMIHRDIKPANIYACRLGLQHDFAKVLDFGLVVSSPTASTKMTRLTHDGLTSGTPAYMAPEMASNTEIDGRADLYGLGCVAYFLLTGQLVFPSRSPLKMLADHLQTQPVPPSQRTELAVPADLEDIVLACLEKNPDRRPQTATELADRLRACSLAGAWTPDRSTR